MKNVLEYLENTANTYGNKVAFENEKGSLTFSLLQEKAKRTGSYILKNLNVRNRESTPKILVFMDKSPECVAAFFGCVYAGCAYIPSGTEMPDERIISMIKLSGAERIICDKKNEERCRNLQIPFFVYEETEHSETDDEALSKVREKQSENDLLYIMFTSGSTGVPKGVMITHRGVILYIDSLSCVLHSSDESIYANQAPFYSDASLKEIYQSIKNGSTVYLVPQNLFLFPVKLVEYLNEKKVNTLCWVSSALAFVSALGTFEKILPEFVRTVSFVGEVLPVKQLNKWRNACPDAVFYNLYGPTEVTGVCCAYEILPDHPKFDEELPLPVGKPLEHSKIYLLKDEKCSDEGEICVESFSLSPGYVNNSEKTEEVFTDNPANPGHRIYRTGDLGRLDGEGNLVFISRKDYQIKHMGYRIELGEIEACASEIEEISEVCCVYNEKQSKIVMFYSGNITGTDVGSRLKKKLPRYMIPSKYNKMEILPKNGTGKIDRKKLYDTETEGK